MSTLPPTRFPLPSSDSGESERPDERVIKCVVTEIAECMPPIFLGAAVVGTTTDELIHAVTTELSDAPEGSVDSTAVSCTANIIEALSFGSVDLSPAHAVILCCHICYVNSFQLNIVDFFFRVFFLYSSQILYVSTIVICCMEEIKDTDGVSLYGQDGEHVCLVMSLGVAYKLDEDPIYGIKLPIKGGELQPTDAVIVDIQNLDDEYPEYYVPLEAKRDMVSWYEAEA